jgi:hypothetical protein
VKGRATPREFEGLKSRLRSRPGVQLLSCEPSRGKRSSKGSRRVGDRGGSEHEHQRALVAWARLEAASGRLPELALLFSVPNGGWRHAVTARRMVAEGALAGVFDLVLPVPRSGYHGLFLEMKAPMLKARGLSALSGAQTLFKHAVARQGYCAIVCFGWDEAAQVLREYLGDTA